MEKNAKLKLSDSPLIKREEGMLLPFLIVTACFMVMVLVFVSLVGVCTVRQSSMNDTLYEGDNVLIFNYPSSVKAGDIVILKADESLGSVSEILLIKRVVAVAGDTIKFVPAVKDEADEISGRPLDGRTEVFLYRKPKGQTEFVLANEPYIKETMTNCEHFSKIEFNKEYEIEQGQIYAMGDNRNGSSDSRVYGTFSTDNIYGKMFYKLKAGSFLEHFFKFVYGDAKK